MRERKGGRVIQDHDLIPLILQGNTHHYQTLVERYQKLVYFTILKIVDGDKVLAEDLSQEVFLSAFRSLQHFRSDSSFSTWLTRIAINRSLDEKKKKALRLVHSEKVLEQVAVTEDEPLSFLVKKESKQKLSEIVKQLPSIYQQVIHYYYFDHLSYQEIAVKEGIEVKTVESRLYRARGMLRHAWEKEDRR